MYLLTFIGPFITVILAQNLVYAGTEHTCTAEAFSEASPRQMQSCGPQLRRRLTIMCGDCGINVVGKRVPSQSELPLPSFLLSKEGAHQMLSTNKRKIWGIGETGIHCECCMNSCSPNEVRQYCKPPPCRRKRESKPNLRHSRQIMEIQDPDEFYESLEKMDEPADDITRDNATMELIRFVSSPLVQVLQRNKLINSRLEEKHRLENKRNNIQHIPDLTLKTYIKRTQLADLPLDKDTVPAPTGNSHIARHHWSPEAKRLLYKLLNKT